MRDYSDPVYEEIENLLQEFTDMDSHGLWDEEKWQAYAKEHASKDLLKYMEKEGEYWFDCEKSELDD